MLGSRWRKRADPPVDASSGDVRVVPLAEPAVTATESPGDSAGRLLDAAGAKGTRSGTAEVSRKHANFIQADDGGSADDVYALMELVQRKVAEGTGHLLRSEIRLLGYPPIGSAD